MQRIWLVYTVYQTLFVAEVGLVLAHANIYLGRKILVSFLVRKSFRLPPSVKWSKDGEKVKWHAFLSPLDKTVSMHFTGKSIHFCWCEPVKVSAVAPNCHHNLLDPWKHTLNWTRKLSFLLKVIIWFQRWEVVNTGNWSGNEFFIICKAIL